METAIYFRVRGRVQGVGYRYFTQQTAHSNSLKGWVRNLFSGDVEGVAVGSESAIEFFLVGAQKRARIQ